MDGNSRLKVAFLEIGHWHASGYISGVSSFADAKLVAVSEGNEEILNKKAKDWDCRKYLDYKELLDKEKPDFVFAFGTHRRMPAIATELINREIPFSMEKPCGRSLDDIQNIVKGVRQKGLFFSIPFIFRVSPWICRLKTMMSQNQGLKYYNFFFRYAAGFPNRYVDWNCEWMLDKREAGGGVLINLGVHFLDLVRYLSGDLQFRSAALSNAMHGLEVEDFTHAVLEGGQGSVATVEVSYRLSRSNRAQTHAFITTSLGSFTIAGEEMRLIDPKGQETALEIGPPKTYSDYTRDTLQRFTSGESPIASGDDLVAVWQVVQQIYTDGHWI